MPLSESNVNNIIVVYKALCSVVLFGSIMADKNAFDILIQSLAIRANIMAKICYDQWKDGGIYGCGA